MQVKHPIIALALSALHGLTGLTILLVSSWFIAASAVATPSFNYMLPAVLIRGLALLRIASGYAEMWVAHYQLLDKLAATRLSLFKRLRNSESIKRGSQTDKLSYQTEDLASLWAGWVNQNATAILSLLLVSVLTIIVIKEFTTLWLVFVLAALVIYSLVILMSRRVAIEKLVLRENLECNIEHHFDSADIWHMYEQITHPNTSRLYRNARQQNKIIEYGISGLLTVSLATLTFVLLHTSEEGLFQPIYLIIPMALLAAVDWFGKSFYSVNRLQDYWLAKANITNVGLQFKEQTRRSEAVTSIKLEHFTSEHGNHIPVSLTLSRGQLALLEGHSGVGKTRLLQAIASLTPHTGDKTFNQQPTDKHDLYEDILYVEQNPYCLSGPLRQNLLIANEKATDSRLRGVLSKVNLSHLKNLNEWIGAGGRQLSGGELKRLGLARAILSDKSVWLLDEPFEALDSENIKLASDLLNQLKKDKLIIVASHIKPETLLTDQALCLKVKNNCTSPTKLKVENI